MLYCQVFCALRSEKALLEKEGRVHVAPKMISGYEILIRAVNPRHRVVRDLENQLFQLIRELGLTPLRRHNVRSTKKAKKDPIDDALAEGNKVLERIKAKRSEQN